MKKPFTDKEQKIMDLLVEAHNNFIELERTHPMEMTEWVSERATKLLKEAKEAFAIHGVTTRLNVDVKIFKKHRCCVGTIRHKSDFGFNHWIVEWDNGNWSREYGLGLNVW
tara:strand:- start:202 stop:534 length:333 start_codon:yes stop_codon:yes gene_type:complete